MVVLDYSFLAELAGRFLGALIVYFGIYSLYYGIKKTKASGEESNKPEFLSRKATFVIVGFALASAVISPTMYADTTDDEVWLGDSSYYSQASVVQMVDMTYQPPSDWYYTDAQMQNQRFSDTEVVAPRNKSVAVMAAWMPYNTTHETFFQPERVDTFRRNIQAGTGERVRDFSSVRVIGDNYTQWLSYNATLAAEEGRFRAHYQVSVSQGRYYILMYYGRPDAFRQHYDTVVPSIQNASLYHPISVDTTDVPEVEPVSPYAGYTDSFGLREGYRLAQNTSLKGEYRFILNATDPIYLILYKQSEYAKLQEGQDATNLYIENGTDLDFTREFFADNYTLYFYNREGDSATVEFELQRISNTTE